jgi:two-component system chemotaxis sensor kinase CheA
MARRARRLVLLADDEPILVRLESRILATAGYDVRTARSADETRSALESSEPVDAVVLDATLSRQLGEGPLSSLVGGPHGPALLLVSGAELDPASQRLLERRGGRFLAKPFEPWQLVGALRELLAARSD